MFGNICQAQPQRGINLLDEVKEFIMDKNSNIKNYIKIFVVVTLIHFVVSYMLFSFLFAVGESSNAISKGPIFSILGILSSILLFLLKVVEYFDKLYYSNVGHGFPNFIYFPIAFSVNSLLWGFIITWLMKKMDLVKGRRSKHPSAN